MSTISVRLLDSLHEAAKTLEKNTSHNHLINLAVSEKLSVLEAEKFLEERAKRGNREKFLKVLKNSPDVEPDEFDKL